MATTKSDKSAATKSSGTAEVDERTDKKSGVEDLSEQERKELGQALQHAIEETSRRLKENAPRHAKKSAARALADAKTELTLEVLEANLRRIFLRIAEVQDGEAPNISSWIALTNRAMEILHLEQPVYFIYDNKTGGCKVTQNQLHASAAIEYLRESRLFALLLTGASTGGQRVRDDYFSFRDFLVEDPLALDSPSGYRLLNMPEPSRTAESKDALPDDKDHINSEFEFACSSEELKKGVVAALNAAGVSMREVARRLDKSPSTIRGSFDRGTRPTISSLEEIAEAAGYELRIKLKPKNPTKS